MALIPSWKAWTSNKSKTELTEQITRIGERMERKTSQIDAQIEKNTATIKDLIVVSRTVVETQRKTEKELGLFIKRLDAFIKGFQKPNGNQ